MAQLPFPPAPSNRPGDPHQPGRRAPQAMTVTQLSSLVKTVLADGLPPRVRVVGEVSNFSGRSHWFFSLKDANTALRCVCFASAVRTIRFPVKDGMEVVATGRIDYYDAQGQLQLYVDHLEPVGDGALELQFRALCDQLRQQGYFDPARKKPLPVMAQRIAVVTSRSAAALQDVIDTARRRWSGCQLLLMDVRVQGAEAAGQIAAAIDALSSQGHRLGIDAILLTRGGGSIEDLWAFNERVVAEALFRCKLPTVAAIGHETDTTVAELVADMRCATPTQAAMTLVPDQAAMAHQVHQLASRLTLLATRCFQHAQQRLDHIAHHRVFREPLHLLDPLKHHLGHLEHRLNLAVPHRLDAAIRRLEGLKRHLAAVGPQNVLARGYSYTLGPNGQVLRSPGQVSPGDMITSVLEKGRLRTQVPGGEATSALPRTTPRRRKRTDQPPDQPGLFGE